MIARIKIQQDLYTRIERAKVNFRKSPKERLNSPDYVNTRLETLEALWAQFTSTHTQIIQESDTTLLNASVYVTENIYENAEELFTEYKFELKRALSKLNATSLVVKSEPTAEHSKAAASQSRSNMIRLPKITIPTFSGNYSEWTSFRDLFTSLIHNNKELDNVQKLHYLKGYLTGEAEQLLRHVQITHDNYSACWEKLEKRYNNKKFLSNCILKRFMSQKNITTESASALKDLLDTTNECLNGLRNLGIDTTTWDIIVIHIICLKLDNETRKQWELKVSDSSDDLPTLKQLQEFLETRFRALECFDSKSSTAQKKPNVPSNHKVHHVSEVSCAYCSEGHKLCNCKGFAKIDVDARRDFIQSGNFCFNCLGSGHNAYACRQSTRCRICQRKHHSLLHPRNVTNSTESLVKPNQSVEGGIVAHATTAASPSCDEPNNITTCFSTSRSQVLLATALVQAQSKTGSGVTLRCLLDQGSQTSFVTESAVQLLGLKQTPHKSTVSGLGGEGSSSVDSKSVVKVKIASLPNPDSTIDVHAFVLGKLTSILPEKRVDVKLWSELSDLQLADPKFNVPGKIDMLLGADIYGQILLQGIIKAPKGTPIAQQTSLGWIISGPIHSGDLALHNAISVNHIHVNENELLKKFWELEADNVVTDPKQHFTEEEKQCEELFAATTERDSIGRYIEKLPFCDADSSCKYGNSEAVATRRFQQLEERFVKDPQLKNDYVELGHTEEVPAEQLKQDAVYLPHHAVIRVDKTPTKVHVVCNASCPGTNGADYDEGDGNPAAADRVLKHVGDLLTGCESVEEGKQIYKKLNELLQKGGFELQKWSNNNEGLLLHINDGTREVEEVIQLKTDAVMKILRLIWNRKNNEFEYSVQLPTLKVPVTKRSVISDISLLLDPLDWMALVIIVAQIFIQELWLSGIEWDDGLPPKLLMDWLSYRKGLDQLTRFKMPRWDCAATDVIMKLQGFCNASDEAFAAVVDLRTIDEGEIVHGVSETITSVEPSHWSQNSSKNTPSDFTSTQDLKKEELWKEGLLRLKYKEINCKKISISDTNLEENPNKSCLVHKYGKKDEATDDAKDVLKSKLVSYKRRKKVKLKNLKGNKLSMGNAYLIQSEDPYSSQTGTLGNTCSI